MDKIKLSHLILITIIFTFFSFKISYAKSTNAKDLFKMLNTGIKPYKTYKEMIEGEGYYSEKFAKLMLQIDRKFDIKKMKLQTKFKADLFLNICRGFYKEYNFKDMEIAINKCIEADDYQKAHNIFVGKRAYSKRLLHANIGKLSAWQFYLTGDKKYYDITIKYSKINFDYKKKRSRHHVEALNNYTIIFRTTGEFNKAIKYQKLALEYWNCFKKISELSKKRQKTCMLEFSNYVVLLMDIGGLENEKEAKKIIDNVIRNETKDNFDFNTRNSIRVALYQHYMNQQDFEKAEKTIYEAIEFLTGKTEMLPQIYADEMYWENMRRLYITMISMGHTYEGEKGLKDLVNKIENKEGPESVLLIEPLDELVNLIRPTNAEDLAFYNDKLVKLLEKHKKHYKMGRYISLASVANAYLDLGDFRKAEKYFTKSIKASPQEENNNIYLGLASSKIALKKFDEATKILNKIKPKNTYQQIGYLAAKGLIYKETGDLKNYTNLFYKNYSFYSNYAQGLISEKGAPSVQYYGLKIITQLHNVTDLSNEDYLKLKNDFNLISKSDFNSAIVELFEILRTSKFNKRVANIIERSQNPKIKNEKRKLQELQIEFEKLPKVALNEKQSPEIIKNLRISKEKIDKQKKLILSKLGGDNLNTYKKYNLKEIQNSIENNQVMVSYFFDPENLYIILLSNNNFEIKKIRKKNKVIEDLITKIRGSLNLNNKGIINKFDISNSNKLYNLIIEPIENKIQSKSELIIIPHKSLNSLPFEILLKNDTKNKAKFDYTNLNWFGKKFAISYYPSIYSYFELKSLPNNKSTFSFVGLGDPKFKENKIQLSKKMDINKVMLRGIADPDEIRKLSELPETRDELKFIAEIFKDNSKLYLGNEFTEDKIKSIDLSKFKFISFATHAVIANQIENIGEPGLILTPPVKANKNNDGILTVSEIERLNLNSDIVILSACNTASEDGSPNANGLSGLTSAFFQAGTKSMLVTHWDVETNSAVYLTTKTFEKLKNMKNLSIALQKTKNEMMDNIETSHPLFWAPFVLIGNLT